MAKPVSCKKASLLPKWRTGVEGKRIENVKVVMYSVFANREKCMVQSEIWGLEIERGSPSSEEELQGANTRMVLQVDDLGNLILFRIGSFITTTLVTWCDLWAFHS
jgi:hypothetical protein